MQNPDVVAVLVQIFRRYDIGLIQEIRDSSETAIYNLLTQINNYTGPSYNLLLSPRLGDSVSKEQYGFFYRSTTVTLLNHYLYNDTNNVFEREPYPALFRLLDGTVFFIVPIHTSPSYAVSEIDALVDVFDDAVRRFGVSDGIVMGDFNAGCSYVTSSDWPYIRLRNESRFVWLIPDSADTTTSQSTSCPYDRFVVNEGPLVGRVINATVFRFDLAYGLNSTLVMDVSDHYPIEMYLSQNQTPTQTSSSSTTTTTTTTTPTPTTTTPTPTTTIPTPTTTTPTPTTTIPSPSSTPSKSPTLLVSTANGVTPVLSLTLITSALIFASFFHSHIPSCVN